MLSLLFLSAAALPWLPRNKHALVVPTVRLERATSLVDPLAATRQLDICRKSSAGELFGFGESAWDAAGKPILRSGGRAEALWAMLVEFAPVLQRMAAGFLLQGPDSLLLMGEQLKMNGVAPCESRTRTLPIRTAARRSHADRKIDSSPLAGRPAGNRHRRARARRVARLLHHRDEQQGGRLAHEAACRRHLT